MANSLLTVSMITRKAIALFKNSNAFLAMIDKQYDDQYNNVGAKVGQTLRIRLPNDFVVRTGATANPQNLNENQVSLTLSTQMGVDATFSSQDLALSLDDFTYRILGPMVNDLAAGIASNIMAGVESVPNVVHNVNGSNATITPTAATWLQAGAVLDLASAPRTDRSIVCDAMTMSRTVNSLAGLFNPAMAIGKQYAAGMIAQNVLGFDWAMDQTVLIHTAGSFSTGTVNGANQTGNTLTVAAISGNLAVGDVITLAGVYGVNRLTKNSTGQLQQFVITAAAAPGATSLSIYPAITPPSAGNPVAYQTVTASPATNAAIATTINASESYRKNFAFHPTACTMASADLDLPTGAVVSAAREAYDGVSLRIVRDYNSTTDQWLTRLDCIYGSLWVRPEWSCVVADSL